MKRFIYTLCASVLFFSCSKDISVDAPALTVSIENARSLEGDTLVFKLGDTCRFSFAGASDNLTFYSGQSGNAYAYHDRTMQTGNMVLSFSSAMQWGNQANTLQLLATHSLGGADAGTSNQIQWTDITSRATLATSATAVASGQVDLSDIAGQPGDSLFVAFKFTGKNGSTQRTWTITNFLVNNVLPDRVYTLASLSSDVNYWRQFKTATSAASWNISASQLQIVGGNDVSPDNDVWLVSKPIYTGRVERDVPTATLKSVNSTDLQGYNFVYTAVGTYTATFAAFNTSIDQTKTRVQSFFIKIIP